jgi:hypothetical protein
LALVLGQKLARLACRRCLHRSVNRIRPAEDATDLANEQPDRLRSVRSFSKPPGPLTLQEGDRLEVPDDGHVECGFEDVQLAAENEVEALYCDSGLRRDAGHGGGEIAIADK